MIENKKIGFIGGGQMCEAIFSGALASGVVVPENILVSDSNAERLQFLQETYKIQTALNMEDNQGAEKIMQTCAIVVLAVKPQYARPILLHVAEKAAKKQLIISIMGGITLEFLSEFFPQNPVLRVMPNTPMLVRKGIAAIACNSIANQQDKQIAQELFSLVGDAYFLEERLIDAQTSVGGCGPAFAYLFIEALADGAVEKGLPREMAMKMAAQTLAGAAEMVLQTGKHPAQLKDSVTSPGGGTIAGVHALESGGFRAAVMNAVVESCDRMIEVGKKA